MPIRWSRLQRCARARRCWCSTTSSIWLTARRGSNALLTACPRVKAHRHLARASGAGQRVAAAARRTAVSRSRRTRDHSKSFDAARLFVRAAHRVDPNLVPAAEAAAIVDICRQVDGLPLALELAASWTRVLSCEAIAAELGTAANCCRLPTPRGRPVTRASRRCSRSPGACSANASARRWRGCRCSAAASRRRWRERSAAFRCQCWPRWWTSRCCARRARVACLHPLVQQFAQAKLEQGGDAEGSAAAHSRYFLRYVADAGHRVRHADAGDPARDRRRVREHPRGLALCREARSRRRSGARGVQPDDLLRTSRTTARRPRTDAQGDAERHAWPVTPKFVPTLAAYAAWMAYRLDRYAEAEASARRRWTEGLREPRSGDRTAGISGRHRARSVLRPTRAVDEAQRRFRQALDLAKKSARPVRLASALDNLGISRPRARRPRRGAAAVPAGAAEASRSRRRRAARRSASTTRASCTSCAASSTPRGKC